MPQLQRLNLILEEQTKLGLQDILASNIDRFFDCSDCHNLTSLSLDNTVLTSKVGKIFETHGGQLISLKILCRCFGKAKETRDVLLACPNLRTFHCTINQSDTQVMSQILRHLEQAKLRKLKLELLDCYRDEVIVDSTHFEALEKLCIFGSNLSLSIDSPGTILSAILLNLIVALKQVSITRATVRRLSCPNLLGLVLDWSRIEGLDLNSFKNLTSVELNINMPSSLNICLPHLQKLHLRHQASLGEVTINCPALRNLLLTPTEITHLNLYGSSLEYLW